jgi:hypothetical protein
VLFHLCCGVHVYVEPWGWADIANVVSWVYGLALAAAVVLGLVRLRRGQGPR